MSQDCRGSAPVSSILILFNFYSIGSIMRAEILISSNGLAAHLNQRVDVSGTMLRLPGVTSCAAHHAYVQIRTRYGGRRARRMHGRTSGNDETDLSHSEGASSSAEYKPGSQNVSPLFWPVDWVQSLRCGLSSGISGWKVVNTAFMDTLLCKKDGLSFTEWYVLGLNLNGASICSLLISQF